MCGGLTFCPSLSRRGKCGVAQGTKEILKVSGYLWKDQNPVRRFSLTPTMNIVRAPYSGPSRKLVVALDIGTTFSGAAYALLEPGQVPETQFVTRRVVPSIAAPVTNFDEREIDT